MALGTKLMMRQGQSLVMTPQLLQAIKLLQFSNLELTAFVQEELERNPLLERSDEAPDRLDAGGRRTQSPTLRMRRPTKISTSRSRRTGRRNPSRPIASALEDSLGTELSNAFDDDRPATPFEYVERPEGAGLSATSWSGSSGAGVGDGRSAQSRSLCGGARPASRIISKGS